MNTSKIILITGEPGCGKTTLIKNISEKLVVDGFNMFQGFYTEELRDSTDNRIGFDVIDIKNAGKRAALARVTGDTESFRIKSAPKVGKYSVDTKSFESIALPAISLIRKGNVYIIDEIGKMEMFSTLFEKSMINLLGQMNQTSESLVIATVPTKSLSLSDKFKSHPFSQSFTVTHQNRNTIINDIYEIIKDYTKNK